MQASMKDVLPRQFLSQSRLATRFLYFGRKTGRVTCLFRQHGKRLEAAPYAGQYVPRRPGSAAEMKMIEDGRIYAITYILSGRPGIRFSDTGASHELQPGDFFQFSGQKVGDIAFAPGRSFSELSICFDGVTGDHCKAMEIWDENIRVASAGLHRFIPQGYLELFNTILDHTQSARSLLSRCTQFINRLYSLVEPLADDDDFSLRACSLISANMGPRFTMNAAAGHMAMGYDEFRRRFKKETGLAPIEYQMRCRMEQACLLLHGHSVKETAAMLGYDDAYAFSKQFKVRLGSAPREYQRQMRRS